MSSSLVELLQMQVDRLEVELKRKTADLERAEKRAEDAVRILFFFFFAFFFIFVF